jgi:hypothetical protein
MNLMKSMTIRLAVRHATEDGARVAMRKDGRLLKMLANRRIQPKFRRDGLFADHRRHACHLTSHSTGTSPTAI